MEVPMTHAGRRGTARAARLWLHLFRGGAWRRALGGVKVERNAGAVCGKAVVSISWIRMKRRGIAAMAARCGRAGLGWAVGQRRSVHGEGRRPSIARSADLGTLVIIESESVPDSECEFHTVRSTVNFFLVIFSGLRIDISNTCQSPDESCSKCEHWARPCTEEGELLRLTVSTGTPIRLFESSAVLTLTESVHVSYE